MSSNVTSDPPAEPVLTVDTREELVYLLGQACERAVRELTSFSSLVLRKAGWLEVRRRATGAAV